MTKKPSPIDKQDAVTRMVNYVAKFCVAKGLDKACVVMWREMYNDCWPHAEPWNRDDAKVHEHLKKHKQAVVNELAKHSLSVVSVGNGIRRWLKHGDSPRLDDHRTATFYRECVAGPHNRAFGLVVFPKECPQDHPLILKAAADMVGRGGTGLTRSASRLETLKDWELISDGSYKPLRGHVVGTCQDVLEDAHPLFPRDAVAKETPELTSQTGGSRGEADPEETAVYEIAKPTESS